MRVCTANAGWVVRPYFWSRTYLIKSLRHESMTPLHQKLFSASSYVQ